MNDTEQIILDKLKELDGKVDKIAEQNERIARLEEKQDQRSAYGHLWKIYDKPYIYNHHHHLLSLNKDTIVLHCVL